MAQRLIIALDAMGGDNAPQSVVRGADIARERFPQAEFLLFGDERKVKPLLDKRRKLISQATLCHTEQIVRMDDKPAIALRAGRQSSMRLAIDAVRNGEAHACVSAGNTGALMAMSKVVLRTLKGVGRPAMASIVPTKCGETVMLDLGANVDCEGCNLVEFAIMGEVFARTVLGLEEPMVGLLNVGVEEMKGHGAVRDAHGELSVTQLPLQYAGFIEGDDIADGTVDVVVTDGFTGNVALKTAEGTAKLTALFLRRAFESSWLARMAYVIARPALRKFKARVDPRRYNGAVFLGLNGVVVKGHGGSDSLAFANAVGVAADLCQYGFIDAIRDQIDRLAAERAGAPAEQLTAG